MARRDLTYYYDSPGRRHSDNRRRRLSIFDWLILVVTLAVAAGMALSWMARWIAPASYGFMSGAGLFAPVLYVANFLCLLYWVIRWRKVVYVPLTVFVAGLWALTLFFRPQFTQSHADHSHDRSLLKVMTYNVRGMVRPVSEASSRMRSSMNEVVAVVDSLRPDILCMQEFSSTRRNPSSGFDAALPLYHYKRTGFTAATGGPAGHGWGNAIYSKYPIVGSGVIDFDGTDNSILWADIAAGRDTIRVFNAHLQTTAIKASDERYLVDMDFVGDSTRTSRVKGIVGRLTNNYMIRAVQADTLAARIDGSPHAVLVCGDFNDTPASWAYRKIAQGLKDSFSEAGGGYGYTYRGFFNLLRIDYMLHSRSMECVEYLSPAFDYSDHNPVAVKLRLDPNTR